MNILVDRLKNRARISSSVDPVLWKHMQQLSDKTRIPLSKLLDEAFEDLLKKYNVEVKTNESWNKDNYENNI